MITIIVQGEGPAQTYWWFLPKLYTGVLIWAVNARIKVEKELRTFAGVYVSRQRLTGVTCPFHVQYERVGATRPRTLAQLVLLTQYEC